MTQEMIKKRDSQIVQEIYSFYHIDEFDNVNNIKDNILRVILGENLKRTTALKYADAIYHADCKLLDMVICEDISLSELYRILFERNHINTNILIQQVLNPLEDRLQETFKSFKSSYGLERFIEFYVFLIERLFNSHAIEKKAADEKMMALYMMIYKQRESREYVLRITEQHLDQIGHSVHLRALDHQPFYVLEFNDLRHV